jgi:hypothetical protein
MPVIEVDDLTFRHPKIAAPAVNGMSFSVDRVDRGEVVRPSTYPADRAGVTAALTTFSVLASLLVVALLRVVTRRLR